MQAATHPGTDFATLPQELRKMVEAPVPYEEGRMLSALGHPGIKNVRVFRTKRKARNTAAKASRRANR